MAVPTARHDLLRRRLERFTRSLPGLGPGGEVRALHAARVASRRLRELLPILQLDNDVTHKLSRRLRKVTKRLGTVRELDVLHGLIDELYETGRHDQAALARIAEGVGRERELTRQKLLGRKQQLAELKQIARKLDRAADTLELLGETSPPGHGHPRGWRWALDARIAHRAAALSDASRRAGALYLAERLHTVRIAIKKLRYALELSAEVSGNKTTPELRTLKRAQDLLGRLHDSQMLMNRVRQVQASLVPPNLSAWRELDALVATLENKCRLLHARYMRDRAAINAIAERLAVQTARASLRPAGPAGRADPTRTAV
jgi:CHAD domain-containing protein